MVVVKKCEIMVKEALKIDHHSIVRSVQRDLVKKVVVEVLTPFQTTVNVDIKGTCNKLDDVFKMLGQHEKKLSDYDKKLASTNMTLLRQLKNIDNENLLLNREVNRLRNIDHAKVIHAKNSFYDPDTATLLPTLDLMAAASP